MFHRALLAVLSILQILSATLMALDWKKLPPIPDANGFAG